MRYFCPECKAYWANLEPVYTICDPVRLCPDHLLELEGCRWIDAGACRKQKVVE